MERSLKQNLTLLGMRGRGVTATAGLHSPHLESRGLGWAGSLKYHSQVLPLLTLQSLLVHEVIIWLLGSSAFLSGASFSHVGAGRRNREASSIFCNLHLTVASSMPSPHLAAPGSLHCCCCEVLHGSYVWFSFIPALCATKDPLRGHSMIFI